MKEGNKHEKSKKKPGDRQCKCTKDNDPDWDGITSLQTRLARDKMGLSKTLSRSREGEGRRERKRTDKDREQDAKRDQLAIDRLVSTWQMHTLCPGS